MSEKAKQELEQIVLVVEEEDFDEVKSRLADRLDIGDSTAYQYVMDYCWVEGRGDDKKVKGVKDPSYEQESDGDEDDELQPADVASSQVIKIPEIEAESGQPTGDKFRNLEKLDDDNHPMIPNTTQYFERPMGEVTDLDKLTWAMAHPDYGTLLVGDAGAGKGQAVKKTANETNRPLVRLNFGVKITKAKLIGHYAPREDAEGSVVNLVKKFESEGFSRAEAIDLVSGGQNNFEWKDGILTRAVRNGWIFLADEVNAAPPEALVALNGLLEDRGNRSLEIEDTGEVITPHPNFKVVGTMNQGYVGTQPLNPAFADRFIKLEYKYLEEKAERKLIEVNTALDDEDKIEVLVEIANDLREQYPSTIQTPISPRMLFKAADMTEIVSFQDAVKTTFQGAMGKEDLNAVMKVLKTKDAFDMDDSDSDGLGELFS